MTNGTEIQRSAGILLHPTSLPGPYGIGELGPEALEFVEFLKDAGQKLWQMLPLNPTGDDGSPYSSYSAFAGNPLLISTERLQRDGLLGSDVPESPNASAPVDYPAVIASKTKLLRQAYAKAKPGEEFEKFREEQKVWLEDYALYMALKDKFGGRAWSRWDRDVSGREPAALEKARRELREEILFHEYAQYLFFEHWRDVKSAANGAGIEIIGDIPIFISHDSADVWANQDLFFLDSSGEPSVVAGVPPDYFSETGQLWGNPLYDWEALHEDGYSWWVERVRMALTLYDVVRIDHFRGFESYWEIPAGAETAQKGRWVEGPGNKPFQAFEENLNTGDEPRIIAEDLGDVTEAVEELRKELGLPGMKVLQFAFSGPDNQFLTARVRGYELGRLHRHPRQRHHRRLVAVRRRGGPELRPPLPRQRVRLRLGLHPARLRLRGPEGRRADAGRSGTRLRTPDERTRHGRGKLGLAAGEIRANAGSLRSAKGPRKNLREIGATGSTVL